MDERDRDSLDEMKKQSYQNSLGAMQAYINALEFHVKELETIIAETERKKTDEEVMKLWDTWREYIANGGTASWPRDAFESIISWYEERIKDLEGEVDKLTLSKQDAEGQLEILRPEYNRLQEKIKELVEGIEKEKP